MNERVWGIGGMYWQKTRCTLGGTFTVAIVYLGLGGERPKTNCWICGVAPCNSVQLL